MDRGSGEEVERMLRLISTLGKALTDCTLVPFIHQQAVEYDVENPYATPWALNTENYYTLALISR